MKPIFLLLYAAVMALPLAYLAHQGGGGLKEYLLALGGLIFFLLVVYTAFNITFKR